MQWTKFRRRTGLAMISRYTEQVINGIAHTAEHGTYAVDDALDEMLTPVESLIPPMRYGFFHRIPCACERIANTAEESDDCVPCCFDCVYNSIPYLDKLIAKPRSPLLHGLPDLTHHTFDCVPMGYDFVDDNAENNKYSNNCENDQNQRA